MAKAKKQRVTKKRATAAAKEAAKAATPSEREQRMTSAFEKWEAAERVQKEIKNKVKEKVNGAQAAMRTTMEMGTSDDKSRLAKLSAAESQWQTFEEVKAEAIEERKHAADVTANAFRRLKEVVENSKQMQLFEKD